MTTTSVPWAVSGFSGLLALTQDLELNREAKVASKNGFLDNL